MRRLRPALVGAMAFIAGDRTCTIRLGSGHLTKLVTGGRGRGGRIYFHILLSIESCCLYIAAFSRTRYAKGHDYARPVFKDNNAAQSVQRKKECSAAGRNVMCKQAVRVAARCSRLIRRIDVKWLRKS